MTSTSRSPQAPAPTDAGSEERRRPSTSYRTDLTTAVLGVWFTVGLFLDAWAHNNVPDLETFFTPWHAVFYSGFVATAAWIAWASRESLLAARRDLRALPRAYASAPRAYASALVAVVGFGGAALGDLLWHTAFGIEQDVDILFSPTHLGLVTAMIVIVTTPLRAAWGDRRIPAAPGFRRLLPALLSLAFATTLVLLFLQYANALTYGPQRIVVGLSSGDASTGRLVTAMFVTNLVLVAPLLTLARRWAMPFGSATMLYAAVAGLSGAVTGFRNVPIVVAVVVAGVLVDVLMRVLRPNPSSPARYRAFAALACLATWTVYIATAFAAADNAIWSTGEGAQHPESLLELTTGAPVVQALAGLLLAVLLVPGAPGPDREGEAHGDTGRAE
jgi:hypothetical protein